MKQLIFHERYEQRARTRLTIDRLARIELNICESNVFVQPLKPFAMRIDRVNVKPVVENRLGFQREGKVIKPESREAAGFLKARITLRILRIDEVKVGVRPPLFKHLASLKRTLKLYLAKVLRPDFKMESCLLYTSTSRSKNNQISWIKDWMKPPTLQPRTERPY